MIGCLSGWIGLGETGRECFDSITKYHCFCCLRGTMNEVALYIVSLGSTSDDYEHGRDM